MSAWTKFSPTHLCGHHVAVSAPTWRLEAPGFGGGRGGQVSGKWQGSGQAGEEALRSIWEVIAF